MENFGWYCLFVYQEKKKCFHMKDRCDSFACLVHDGVPHFEEVQESGLQMAFPLLLMFSTMF